MQKHKHLSNQDTWDTYGRRILFIINNERVQITTQRLRQGLLCNQRILSSTAPKDFCIQTTSTNFLSKSISNTLPKAYIYMDENKAVSKVEEVETVKKIKVNGLTNLK